MKKMFLSLLVMMLAVVPMMADNDKIITREELPEQAQMFLTKHFENADVLYAKAERDMGVVTSYDVVLDGNVKVEFNRSGEWTNVDCERGQVPDSLLPQGVLDYVTKKFAKAYVVEIERGRMGYEVKLSNDLDLDFDKNGKFLRVD
ncbi:MAG: PepSY-like domain-containing protein [Paludibacteraceae bacterium]|nr:PepSY-like domain-containing protein [Paludibacteraceae bacterium]